MNPGLKRVSRGLGRFGSPLAMIFVLLGLLAVGVAWNGAAGFTVTAAQMPYLITGLGLGLSLVFVGVGLMIVQAHREDRARLEAKLDQVIDAIGSAGLGGERAPRDLTGLVVAGSASYHVPGCKLVDGREAVAYLTPEEAVARYLTPCRVCQPEPSNVTTL